MLTSSLIFISLLTVVALLALSVLLGFFLQFTVNKLYASTFGSKSLSLYWQLITGTLLLISIFAILSTKGLTLFLIVPILLFYFVKKKLEITSENKEPSSKQHILFFICSVVFNFFFYLWAIQSFSQDYVTYVSGDFNIYFRIAQRLNEFGIESLNLDPINTAKYASPYHYADIWMYAFVSKFVSANPSVVFLIAFTHFSVIFINGIYTYAYQRFALFLEAKKGFLFLLIFAGLFTGFSQFFPKFIIPSAESYTLSVMNWSKVLVPSCFLIGLLILAKDKNWWAFILLAMIGGLSFINALPAIFMTVFLVLAVNLLRKNIRPKQWLYYHLCYVLCTIFFLVVLYKILPNILGVSAQEATGVELKKAIDVKAYLSTASKIFIGGWFQLFVLTPFAIIFLVGLAMTGRLKQLKQRIIALDNDILFMIFIVFSGLSCWALLHPFAPDAVQFYTNILAPVYAIVTTFLVMYIILVIQNKILSILAVTVLATSIYIHKQDVFFVNKHSRAEWNLMTDYLQKKYVGHSFVNIQPLSHFNSFFDKNTIYFMPLPYLNYQWSDYHNFSLNAPFIPINEKSPYANEERVEVNLAPFSIYYKDKMKLDSHRSAEDIMGAFIQEQNIGYISVSKDTVLPPYFRSLVKDSVSLEKANFVVYRVR